MADQRRRGGRGRSGKGGRIPRRGDGRPAAPAHDEQFISFPLEITGPIRVPSVIDEAGIEGALRRALEGERRQAAVLAALLEAAPDPRLSAIRGEGERHLEAAEQLARELGVDVPRREGAEGGTRFDESELVAVQRVTQLAWLVLQRAAHASGDRRIHRAVQPVLRDKTRHAPIVEEYAVGLASHSLFRQLED